MIKAKLLIKLPWELKTLRIVNKALKDTMFRHSAAQKINHK